MLAYIFIRPVGHLASLSTALHSEDPEDLTKYAAPLEQAFKELKEWAVNIGAGKCLSAFGTEVSMEIPMDNVPKLSEFLHKFEYTTKLCFAVGIGLKPSEAYMAMCQSENENGARIVLFTDDVETDGQLDKGEADTMHHDLARNLELDNDAPEQDDEAAKLQPQGDPKAKKEEQSAKQKIIETLMMVKEHAPVISQLKELNPKAFEAVKKVIDAMIQMAQKDLSINKTEELPAGAIKNGQIKVQSRDEGSRQITGSHWHRVVGGMALGPTGHAVSGHEPDKE
jgi:hypothetical protein